MATKKSGNGMKAASLAVVLLAFASVALYLGSGIRTARAGAPASLDHKKLSSFSVPLFFEPNQGQTAPQVKFLARGSGYGLFLTADEAVLELRPSAISHQPSGSRSQVSDVRSQGTSSSVIRMRLEGTNPSARVFGASLMPGKSSYYIGSDSRQWHRDIPQFAKVQYQSVYPGIDLVYYGDQGQLEYDFRVAPAADPAQIALSFRGASTRIDSGDLVLSTANGDIRFHAPYVYQQLGSTKQQVSGSFRQLAGNKIGFAIGTYDRSRELVIDPVLTYSTYLGGTGTEGFTKVAVDSGLNIYVAGSTTSTNFPVTDGSTLKGTQNLFISKINPLNSGTAQLVYSIYLGGSKTDTLSGIAVGTDSSIYVAGYTSSPDFPTTTNAFQQPKDVEVAGTHGFLSKLTTSNGLNYSLNYSTYLSGNGTDHVTGLAIDASNANAYVTGDTTSTDGPNHGFPSNGNAFQPCPFAPAKSGQGCTVLSGPPQFFASQVNTNGSGTLSMLYSTYFGGGNPAGATATGGGIAVDPSGSNVSMYFTGTTNMVSTTGPNGEAPFPLFNAQQSCLNEASQTTCTGVNGTTNTDAFIAKLSPTAGSTPAYSTYLGGGGTEAGLAVAVDSASNAYVTGSTNSASTPPTAWVGCNGFQCTYSGGGNSNAYIAKIGPKNTAGVYPITYFSYLGGSGPDVGNDIKVDSLQGIHLVGSTSSPNLPLAHEIYNYQGAGDAFAALIVTTGTGILGAGDYVTYLGGTGQDQGTSVAVDIYNATYVAGNTQSSDFPTMTPYQASYAGAQDSFVTRIGGQSTLEIANRSTSPSPSPVAAGTPVAFTFDIINHGPDNAYLVTFFATINPITGTSNQSAKVTSNTGTCGPISGSVIQCNIPTLAACNPANCTAGASVEVDLTPTITGGLKTASVSALVSANGSSTQSTNSQTVNVVDFSVSATNSTPTINAGDTATIQANLCPTNSNLGYSATITPSQTTSPSMVTASTPTFNPTTVTLSGSGCSNTTLTIATVARPVTTGARFHHGPIYASWLPIGGLSLAGLGIGASTRRRRWFLGMILGLIAGFALLQAGCGSASSPVTSSGGTQAGTYQVTINGSAGTGASHSAQVSVTVR